MRSVIGSMLLLGSQFGQGAVIDLHRNEFPEDDRWRVWVQFLQPRGGRRHSLLLDSGSRFGHILCTEVGVCDDDPFLPATLDVQGYVHVDGDPEIVGPCTLKFGTEANSCSVEVKVKVSQKAEIIGVRDRVSFPQQMHLTTGPGDTHVGLGLIGAAPASWFAENTGIFTLIPPPLRDWPRLPRENAGMLVVGERDEGVLSQRCRGRGDEKGTDWVPLVNDVFDGYWVVDGSAWVGGSAASSSRRTKIVWVVDTGATGFFVPMETYELAMAAIAASGSTVGELLPRSQRTRISDCDGYETRFPIISIQMGPHFIVEITPKDYVDTVTSPDCIIQLVPAQIPRHPGVQIIGTGLLWKLVTVFDAHRNRMGFCHLEHSRPPRPLLERPPAPVTDAGGTLCAAAAASPWIGATVDILHQNLVLTGSVVGDMGGTVGWNTVAVDWRLDPDADGIYVPERIYALLMDRIQQFGGEPGEYEDGFGTRVSNWPPLSVSDHPTPILLPTLMFKVGSSSVLRIPPTMYMTDGNLCTLHPSSSEWGDVSGNPMVPLGPAALQGRIVEADPANTRVRICNGVQPTGRGVIEVVPHGLIRTVIGVLMLRCDSLMNTGGPPAVDVVFGDQGLNRVYSLLINTASSIPRMRFGGNALAGDLPGQLRHRTVAARDEGYIDTGAVRIPTDFDAPGFMQRIDEAMVMEDQYSRSELRVSVHMDIVDPHLARWREHNELAADRSSQFALTVGVFALIPDSSRAQRLQVLVGQRDDARLSSWCSEGEAVKWLMLGSGKDWIVAGDVGRSPTKWLVDSVGGFVLLPPILYSTVTDSIAALAGTEYIHASEDMYGRIPDCDDELISRLPAIRITVKGAVEVRLEGRDYVFRLEGGGDECYSRLLRGVDSPEVPLGLGFPFLNKVVTVFDNELNRIGFCPARYPL